MTHDEIYAAAFEVVREAHHGQTRADGVTPYITHPMAVVQRSLEGFEDASDLTTFIQRRTSDLTAEDCKLALMLAAMGHDVLEDCEGFDLVTRWKNVGVPDAVLTLAIGAIKKLTNTNFTSYLAYLLNIGTVQQLHILSADSLIALIVKGADIRANYAEIYLIPSKARQKNARVKCELAYYILFNQRLA